jgi:hypothetical protein
MTGSLVFIGNMPVKQCIPVPESGCQRLIHSFISPTASAKRFRGLDDQLVRMMNSADSAAADLARVSCDHLAVDGITAVWDQRNLVYAEDYLQAIAVAWQSGSAWNILLDPWLPASTAGGLAAWSYRSSKEGLTGISSLVSSARGGALLLIANGADAAARTTQLDGNTTLSRMCSSQVGGSHDDGNRWIVEFMVSDQTG